MTVSHVPPSSGGGGGTPDDGSVTDAKIASPGLAESSVVNLVTDLAAKVVPLVPTATKTADYTAVVNDLVVVDTTAGSVIVTLPASVTVGKIIGVRRADGSANTLTVARSASDVFVIGTGTATSHGITLQDRIITFQSNGSGSWYLLNGYQSLASLDTRYTSTAQTLTNKRITKRVATLTDAATVTPDVDSFDGGKLTSLSQTTVFANPTGTPTAFQQYMLRVKSTSAQAISFGSQYRGGTDIALPTTTSGSSKTDYYGFQYNSDDTKWDLVAAARGF